MEWRFRSMQCTESSPQVPVTLELIRAFFFLSTQLSRKDGSITHLPIISFLFIFLWMFLVSFSSEATHCIPLGLTRLLHIQYSVNNKIWLCGQNQIITLKLVLKWKCAEGEGSDMEKVVKMLFWLHSRRKLREWGKGEKKNKDKIAIIFLFSFLGYWTNSKLFFPLQI